jgi:methyl-accepting chemotaxis protein
MRRLTSTALPGIMLVIVVLWALTAVIFLTGILAAANRIESRVGIINNALTPINTELDVVPILTNVVNSANQIRDAAANLSPTIARVTDSAASIDQSLNQVEGAVPLINQSAKQINASVQTINESVNTIGPNLQTVTGLVGTINESVDNIDQDTAGVLNNVYDIRSRVVLATSQADDIIRNVRQIKGDAAFISATVGTEGIPSTVNNNADDIEDAPLLLNVGNGGVLREMALASARQDPAAAQAGIPALDLLPQIPALGLPALPLPPVGEVPSLLNNLLQGLPIVGDTGDLLGQVVAPK